MRAHYIGIFYYNASQKLLEPEFSSTNIENIDYDSCLCDYDMVFYKISRKLPHLQYFKRYVSFLSIISLDTKPMSSTSL